MKRILGFALILLIAAIFVGYVFGQSQMWAGWNAGQVLTLVALNIVIGLVLSVAIFVGLIRLLRPRFGTPTKGTRQAIGAAVAVIGLLLAIGSNYFAGQFLRGIIFGFQHSSHLLLSRVEGFLFTFFFVGLLFGIAYILHRLYEERIGQKVTTSSRKLPMRYRVVLLVKLVGMAVFVYVLTLFTATGDWSRQVQSIYEQDFSSWWGEHNDSLAFVSFRVAPVTQEGYLKAALLISRELNKRPPTVILLILPTDLRRSGESLALISQLANERNVIFSIPPSTESDPSEHWVKNPGKGIADFDWGVASGVKDNFWYRPQKFYPLEYREVIDGYVVSDAGVRAVSRFLGISKNPDGLVIDHSYKLQTYETGLFKDMSASIRPRLDPFSVTKLDIETRDESAKPFYVVMENGVEQRVSTFPDTMRYRFANRIVIIDQGLNIERQELFGWREPYAWSQARIIHQILRNESTIPLDAWTPAFVAGVLLLSIVCMLYLKPLLASVLIFLFATMGQLWIDRQLLSHFGLILEIVPPMLAGLWSIPFLLLVRVLHERRQLDVDEKSRIVQELRAAHDMQMGLLPSEDPKIPGYEISGICKPADEVGGDFFDYVWLDERKARLGIAIGDVSGKAMKAAITAVLTSGMVYREVGTNETPKSILRKINRPMYLKTERRMFTAMMFAVIDVRKRKLTFSNAGQMQPMLKRRGAVQMLSVDGVRLPLGMMEDVDYHEMSMPLRPKDVVVFCTDGIPEAMNAKNEMFGFERFESIVKESAGNLPAKLLAAAIVGKVTEFTGSTKQHDDMTVVVVRVL